MSVEPRRPDSDAIDDAVIVGALQAMPAVSPASDLWPDIAAGLASRRHAPMRRARVMRYGPLAAAASLLLAVVVVLSSRAPERVDDAGMQEVVTEPAKNPAVAFDDQGESGLVARSQWLERLVESPALAPVVLDGDQALLEQGLRARIVGIDAALVDEPEQPQLWRARVSTLGELAELRWAGRRAGLVSTAGVGSDDARLQWIQ